MSLIQFILEDNMQKYKVSIEYCVQWNYTPRAVSLTQQLTENFTPAIESLTLIPSGGGRFEVMVGDELIYSKLETGRHAEDGEVAGLFEKKVGLEPVAAD